MYFQKKCFWGHVEIGLEEDISAPEGDGVFKVKWSRGDLLLGGQRRLSESEALEESEAAQTERGKPCDHAGWLFLVV